MQTPFRFFKFCFIKSKTQLKSYNKSAKINNDFFDSYVLNEILIKNMLQNILRIRDNKAEVYVRSLKIISIKDNVISFGMLKNYGVFTITIERLIQMNDELIKNLKNKYGIFTLPNAW